MATTLPRIARIARSPSAQEVAARRSRAAAARTWAGGSGSRRMIARAVMLLPQPDSPTSPRMRACGEPKADPFDDGTSDPVSRCGSRPQAVEIEQMGGGDRDDCAGSRSLQDDAREVEDTTQFGWSTISLILRSAQTLHSM